MRGGGQRCDKHRSGSDSCLRELGAVERDLGRDRTQWAQGIGKGAVRCAAILAQHQDRHLAGARHSLRDAAQCPALEAGISMTAHHDQIDVFLAGDILDSHSCRPHCYLCFNFDSRIVSGDYLHRMKLCVLNVRHLAANEKGL
jgi:hypothetical protein